ncbi:MAG: hypothetical protein JW854_12885 [Actinobacteria bacterium]|nr:hypothetical protein [Actinomycetota bacterium]
MDKKKICGNCGLPSSIGKGNMWHANGVITASYPPHIRGTLYDIDELNALFPAISERIGFDITRLVVEGKRKDGKRYADSLARNIKEKGREPAPVEIYEMIARFCSYWGLGLVSVAEYVEGERLTLGVRNVYSEPMYMGDWSGVFEAMEKRRGDPRWRDEDVHDMIDVVAVEGEPELEVRIEQEIELGIPVDDEGDLQYRHCPECEVPLEISKQFSWDADDANIVERDSGKRFILHNTNGFAAVVRVLREELGDEIDGIITGISRDYAREYYQGIGGETSMDAELMKFPLRSWGRPTRLLRSNNGYGIRIANPYSSPVLAGRLWGLVETFEGRTFSLQVRGEEEGVLDLALNLQD